MDKDLNSILSDIKKDIVSLIDLKLRIFKLNLYEKTSRLSSFFLYGLIFSLVVFFILLFLFLSLGFYLGDLLHSYAAGMGIVALLYAAILAFLLMKRGQIQTWLMNLFISELTLDDNNDDNEQK